MADTAAVPPLFPSITDHAALGAAMPKPPQQGSNTLTAFLLASIINSGVLTET